jgi:thiamine kinase-like enzyme
MNPNSSNINVNELYKSNGINSNTNSKFIVSCSEKIIQTKTTEELLDIIERIQKSDKNALLIGSLLKRKSVVIKISNNERILYERNIEKNLNNFIGFIKFICDFSCNDNFTDYTGNHLPHFLCKNNSSLETVHILVMPYYKNKSLKDFIKTVKDLRLFRSLLNQVFVSYYFAFKETAFIHNDFHIGNILINKTTKTSENYYGILEIPLFGYKTIIMDFESSVFATKSNKKEINSIFLSELNRFYFECKTECLYIPQNDEFLLDVLSDRNNKIINDDFIFNILNSVENITFGPEKPSVSDYMYNPNVY